MIMEKLETEIQSLEKDIAFFQSVIEELTRKDISSRMMSDGRISEIVSISNKSSNQDSINRAYENFKECLDKREKLLTLQLSYLKLVSDEKKNYSSLLKK